MARWPASRARNVYSRPKGARIVIATPALTEVLVKVASRQRPAEVEDA